MMNEPIPISKDTDEVVQYREQKHRHRLQWGFLVIIGMVFAAFLVPLAAFLTRLALGG